MSLASLATNHSLLLQFDQHPQERELIGKIILAYGELEFMLLDMLRATLGEDNEDDPNTTVTAVRILYRLRSEANRLSVADALIRPRMQAHGLLQPYAEAHSAMFACKNIRNRYAHAQWISTGVLRAGDLDEAAKSTGATAKINFKLISLAHLKQEFDYFAYTEHALMYATNQLRLKTGQELPRGAVIAKPQKRHAPKLGSPLKGRSHPKTKKDSKRPQ